MASSTCSCCGTVLIPDARFCPQCGVAVPTGRHDERRPVTLLFVDIVGSTVFAEVMDPEDWKAVIDTAMRRFSAVVERNGGHVAQLLGDGLLAFYGAPVAHEDDALRAVRAGLDLVDAARLVPLPPLGRGSVADEAPASRLAVRVGISTGEVVVGEIGGPMGGEYLAVGDAVTVAARLQALAQPMCVTVSEVTYQLVAGAVEATELGTVTLKGHQAPTTAYRISAVRPGPVRGRGSRSDHALIGRDDELSRLLHALEVSRAGPGVVLDLVGEPGIGKTRLLRAWRERATQASPGVRWIEAGCDAVLSGHPYSVAGAVLTAAASCDPGATPDEVRAALTALSGTADLGADAVPLWAWMLGLPATPGDEALLAGLDAQALQSRAARTLRMLLASLAARRQVVLVVEDVHSIDPSSGEVLVEIMSAVVEGGMVVCLSRRPDATAGAARIQDGLAGLPEACRVELDLGPLAAEAQRLLVATLLGGLPTDEVEAVIERRCDGNPLFIEEIVEALHDRGLLRRDDQGRLATTEEAAAIPLSLQGLLHARLDALRPAARRLVVVGSVVGRRFEPDLVRSVIAEADGVPEGSGEAPEAAGLVSAAAGDETALVFRHALIQEAAYASLTREERGRLHGLVGRRLEVAARAAGTLVAASPTLVHHFGRAGDDDATVRYGRMAAERAAAAYAVGEADTMYAAAISAARALAVADPADGHLISLAELLAAHGALLARHGRPEDALAACVEALTAMPSGRSSWRARTQMTCGDVEMDRRRFAAADERFEAAAALLGDAPPPDPSRALDWWAAWLDLKSRTVERAYWRADELAMQAAIEELEGPLAVHGTAAQQADYYHNRAERLMLRDRFVPSDEALGLVERAMEANRRHGLRRGLAFDHFWLGFTCLWRREEVRAEEELRTAIVEASEIGDPLIGLRALAYLGVLLRRQHRTAEAPQVAARTIEVAQRLGQQSYQGYGLSVLACVALAEGDLEAARRDAGMADALFVRGGTSFPFRWLALWPLIACDTAGGDFQEAVSRCPPLLEPTAQLLPSRLAEAVEAVVAVGSAGDERDLRRALDRAVAAARLDGYL